MNDNLPDDPKQWPGDPFELLGVSPDSDSKTVRRAYFKAIRKYKAEKFPVEFQLIHEAHERAKNMVRSDQGSASFFPSVQPTTVSSIRDQTVEGNEGQTRHPHDAVETDSNEPAQGLDTQTVDPFIALLDSGEFDTAFELLSNAQPSPKTILQTFFLSRFFPEVVDAIHSRESRSAITNSELYEKQTQWLLEALMAPELYYQSMTQLIRMFDSHPNLAISDPVSNFLVESPIDMALEVCRLRWRAIGSDNWAVVIKDFHLLKPRFESFDSRWTHFVSESMEFTVWQRNETCQNHTASCWDELSESLENPICDKVELLMLAAKQFHTYQKWPEWAKLIPASNTQSPDTRRKILLPLIKDLAKDPAKSLKTFDQLCVENKAVMCVFKNLLEGCVRVGNQRLGHHNANDVRELVIGFFDARDSWGYRDLRLAVVEFCCFNKIDMAAFLEAATSLEHPHASKSWLTSVHNALPSMCLYQVCQLAEV